MIQELPLYQIVNWNDYFENSKSRQRNVCGFVCVPNKHGGLGWTAVMNSGPNDEGAAVYGTWINIIEYISRQRAPREGYLTSDGKKDGMRLCIAELARMLKVSPGLVRRTLSVLCQVGWLRLVIGKPEVTAAVTVPVTASDRGDGHSDGQQECHSEGHLNGHSEGQSEDTVTIPVTASDRGDGHSDGQQECFEPSHRKKERKNEPSIISQGEIGDECMNIEQAKKWVNSLFGRQREWSYEELQLLSTLLPIDKADRALLSWAYTLPRDAEGWVLIDGARASKPKDSLVALLREFSSEIDKWRTVRSRGVKKNNGAANEPLPVDWVKAAKNIYGPDVPLPSFVHELPQSVRSEIEAELKGSK